MGVPPDVGMGALRFSLGRYTTRDDVDMAVERLSHVVADVS
jgi:cysteine desulfurase